jgi:hypothetical protein
MRAARTSICPPLTEDEVWEPFMEVIASIVGGVRRSTRLGIRWGSSVP